jgi:hypothetical protein
MNQLNGDSDQQQPDSDPLQANSQTDGRTEVSPELDTNAPKETASKPEDGEEIPLKSDWHKPLDIPITEWLVAFFTLVIMASSIVYTVYARRQWKVMRESNKISRNSLESVQRAFVSTRRVEVTPIPDKQPNQVAGVQIDIGWENNGTTPAKSLTQHISTKWDDKPLPSDFGFPDEWMAGNEHTSKPTYLGPKGSLGGGIFIVPAVVLKQIQDGQRYVSYWGWVRYRDVFKNWHVTEICFELKSNGPMNSANTFPFRLDSCSRHNCIDEDCTGIKSALTRQ